MQNEKEMKHVKQPRRKSSAVALLLQTMVCWVYAIVVLFIGFAGIFVAEGFLDLIVKLCFIPAVLVPMAGAGAMKKMPIEKFASSEYNKAVTEGFYKSISIVLPLNLLLPILEAYFDITFAWELVVIIVCAVALVASLVFSRLKAYTRPEKKYRNAVQLMGLLGVLGGAAFYIGIDAVKSDIFSLKSKAFLFTILSFVGCALVFMWIKECACRLACVSHKENYDTTGSFVLNVFIAILTAFSLVMFALNADMNVFELLLPLIGVGAMLVFEIIYFALEKKAFKDTEADKIDVRSGKVEGLHNLNFNFDWIFVKKWNVFAFIIVAAVIILQRIPFMLINGDVMMTIAKETSKAYDFYYLARFERLIWVIPVALCLLLNNAKKKYDDTDVFPQSIGGKIATIIPTVIVAFVGLFMLLITVLGGGGPILVYNIDIMILLISTMIIYFKLGKFLTQQFRMNKVVAVFIPVVMFLAGEALTEVIEMVLRDSLGYGMSISLLRSIVDLNALTTDSYIAIAIAAVTVIFCGLLYLRSESLGLSIIPGMIVFNLIGVSNVAVFKATDARPTADVDSELILSVVIIAIVVAIVAAAIPLFIKTVKNYDGVKAKENN